MNDFQSCNSSWLFMKSYFIYIHSLANKETDINDFLLQQNMINKSRLFVNALLCSYLMSDDSMKL